LFNPLTEPKVENISSASSIGSSSSKNLGIGKAFQQELKIKDQLNKMAP
jgi:hypothetical protein